MKTLSKITNLLQRYHLTLQAVTFILIGAFSTLISYSTFLICLRYFSIHYLIANILGFCTSIGFNYYCNKRWTFKVQETGYFRRYFMLYLVSLGLSSLLLRFFVEFCQIIPEISNIITIILVTAFNFSGAKFLVFRK